MDHNPFAPPTAAIADPDTASVDTPFFAVSITKLVVLSFFTFSLYELYWFYRNWTLVRGRENSDISPVWRTIFGVIFCYPYLKRFRDYQSIQGMPPISAGALASGWIATNFLGWLPDPFWMVSLFTFVFLIPVQVAANQINERQAPEHDRNERFGAWNWVAIVFGGLLFVTAMIGTMLPGDS